jgi:hypothetical protein
LTASGPPEDPDQAASATEGNGERAQSPGSRLEKVLIEALADRHEIDWDAALERAGSPSQRATVAKLRKLSRFARRPESPSLPASGGALGRDTRRSLWLWEWAIMALAAAQIVAGVVGSVLGAPDDLPLPLWTPVLGFPCVAAAAWLLFAGREDARAQRLAGAFLLTGGAFALRPASWWLGSECVFLGIYPDAFGGVFLWNFAREFPRPKKLSRQEWWLDVGALGALFGATVLFGATFLGCGRALPGPFSALAREHPSHLYWYIVLLTGGAALVLSIVRTRHAAGTERDRFTLFLAGILLGLGPLYVEVLLEATFSGFAAWMSQPGPTFWAAITLFVFLCAMAVATSYSVISVRIFEVRLTIRRALLPSLIKPALGFFVLAGSVVALEPIIGTTLVAEPDSGRTTWVLLLLVVLAAFLKDVILQLLDRTFFRDALARQRMEAEVIERMRLSRTLAELESELDTGLGGVIRARHAILFAEHRMGQSASFRPARGLGHALPADAPLSKLASDNEVPLVTAEGERDSCLLWLTPDDQAWLVEHGLALLMPIRDSSGAVVALVGVGSKVGGEPYTDDEKQTVQRLAEAASFMVETLKLRTASGELPTSAFECEACGEVASSNEGSCECGGLWSPARLPYWFAGKFQLEQVLGRGGMGVVYRATDTTLQRKVALKTLPRVGRRDADRLREEARRMASIEHPHLARIHGLEGWAGIPVLVMEFLVGGTLSERLKGPWPWRDALALGVSLCDALVAMHARGLVHRDLKPSNVGFAADGAPKLLDFGLARFPKEGRDGEEGGRQRGWLADSEPGVAGTMLYLPPEALRGEDPGERQDLWALGMMLYQVIAGRHPFRGSEAEASLRRNQMPPIPSLARVQPGAPAPVAGFLERTLNPDPGLRPGSAGEVLDELRRLQ